MHTFSSDTPTRSSTHVDSLGVIITLSHGVYSGGSKLSQSLVHDTTHLVKVLVGLVSEPKHSVAERGERGSVVNYTCRIIVCTQIINFGGQNYKLQYW